MSGGMPAGFVRRLLPLALAAACSKTEPAPVGGGPATRVAASASASAGPGPSAAPVPVEAPATTVGLDGALHAAPEAAGRRIYARSLHAWIYEHPSRTAERLGYFRAGASLTLRGERAGTSACAAGWFPVAPRGFVCAEGSATLDPNDAVVAAFHALGPSFARKLPYIYGTVRKPGPIYSRLPTRVEAEQAESDLDERMASWLAADGEIGASYAQHVWLRGEAAPDARAAWEGKRPGSTRVIHVEAASWRGRAVFFRLIAPWTKPERQDPTRSAENPVTQAIGLTLIFVLGIGAVVLARRNLHLDRSDRAGARRLAWFVFVCTLIAWALEADHITVVAEVLLLVMAISSAMFAAGVVWVLYVALEPYVRRRWPHTIITWNRLLAGHWRDPVVGRDLLVGLTYGMVQCALSWIGKAVVLRVGPVEPVPLTPVLDPLLGSRYIVTAGFGLLYSSIVSALGVFVLLFLLRLVLRREWLAVGVFILLVAGASAAGSDVPWLQGPLAALMVGVAIAALLRFGLVAYIVGNFVTSSLTVGFPLADDPSKWYSGPTLAVMIGLSGAVIYAYRLVTPRPNQNA